MKAGILMKTITNISPRLAAGLAVACCLSLFPSTSSAIEGLNISAPPTNVVLSWPSDPSETYLIQYRHTLSATDSWTTLADYYPPDYTGLNITYFYDTNIDYGTGIVGGGSGGGSIPLLPSIQAGPLAIPSDGSGDAVPLSLYPPGFDLSNFLILDPASSQWVNGASYSAAMNANGVTPLGGPIPLDGGGGGSTNAAIPGTGFYRVVRDGVHLVGISNNMVLSGIVTIPVELGNDGGQVSTMSMTENDAPIGNSTQSAPLSNPHALTLDTTLMANGVHQIYGNARWDDTNGGVWEYDSPVFSVTTSNEITLENWMPTFGELDNTLLIRATSAHIDTDWQVDVYDSSNLYVGSFVGHTYDGDIYIVWNLFDYYGIQHTNDNFFTFKVSTEYVDPPLPKTYKATDPWSGRGAWAEVCQHAWDNASDAETLYQELNGFVGVAGQMGANLYPNQSSDGSPYGLTFGSDNPQGDTDWATFRQALFNPLTRNLVYFGHGGQDGLGYNPANTNRYIKATEIANILHTIPAGQTNRHAFRFVFVDACSTALGTMPESFGILHKEDVPAMDYINSSTRFSTYVGWPKDKMIGILSGAYINYDHINFINHIQMEMIQYGRGIKQAIRNASHYSDVHGSFGEESMKVYGYWDLTVGAYNN